MKHFFHLPAPAMEFARNNSLICYYDPREFWAFIASDEEHAKTVALNRRTLLLYEPCEAGGLHVWAKPNNRDGSVSSSYWCDECHAIPPSVAIVGAQGLS
jgi:hypothetical protein